MAHFPRETSPGLRHTLSPPLQTTRSKQFVISGCLGEVMQLTPTPKGYSAVTGPPLHPGMWWALRWLCGRLSHLLPARVHAGLVCSLGPGSGRRVADVQVNAVVVLGQTKEQAGAQGLHLQAGLLGCAPGGPPVENRSRRERGCPHPSRAPGGLHSALCVPTPPSAKVCPQSSVSGVRRPRLWWALPSVSVGAQRGEVLSFPACTMG